MTLQEQFNYAISKIVSSDFCKNYVETLYGANPIKDHPFYMFYDTENNKTPVYDEVAFEKTINEIINMRQIDSTFPICYMYNIDSKEFADFIQDQMVSVIWEKE